MLRWHTFHHFRLAALQPCSPVAVLKNSNMPLEVAHCTKSGATMGNWRFPQVSQRGAPIIQVVDHLTNDEIMKYVQSDTHLRHPNFQKRHEWLSHISVLFPPKVSHMFTMLHIGSLGSCCAKLTDEVAEQTKFGRSQTSSNSRAASIHGHPKLLSNLPCNNSSFKHNMSTHTHGISWSCIR